VARILLDLVDQTVRPGNGLQFERQASDDPWVVAVGSHVALSGTVGEGNRGPGIEASLQNIAFDVATGEEETPENELAQRPAPFDGLSE
jgi:hypothetical protein